MITLSNLDEVIPVKCNTEDTAVFGNVAAAAKLDLPWLQVSDPHDGIAVIVGGGPSMKRFLPLIAQQSQAGHTIFALNGTLPTLKEAGIVPDYFVMLDSRAENLSFIDPECGAHNLIASQCHPSVFDALKDKKVTVWHPNYPGIEPYITERECALIGGGTTVGLQTLSIAYAMGYREIHLYGYDSSYNQLGEGHAYPQEHNKDDAHEEFVVNGKTFVAAIWMVRQAMEFQECAKQLIEDGTTILVHGFGLLPEIASTMFKPQERVLTAVYDLASSPPTFDFVGFLHEAERARIRSGFDRIDMVFQPGPVGGFRLDNLPPPLPMREGMLWRVCVALARMLPSVRNITVLKDRQPLSGDIFPEKWSLDNPVSHYGNPYLFDLQPILRPSDLMRDYITGTFKNPYVVINLRHSPHWNGHNSDFKSWRIIAAAIEREGYDVIWLPDSDGLAPAGGTTVLGEAFWDLDMRAALFENAALILSVNAGTMCLMGSLKCNYMIFMKPDAECPSSQPEFYARVGWKENHQISTNGRIIWGAGDSPDIVLPELEKTLFSAERKTA